MAMHWVKLYNSWEVRAQQWGQSESVIAQKDKATAIRIQSLLYKMFDFDCIQEIEIYIISIDGMCCETEEFWLDCSANWDSLKRNTF